MKAILSDNIDRLRAWRPSFPAVSPLIWRAGLGVGVGIILILFLSLFSTGENSLTTFKLDSERLSLGDLFAPPSPPDLNETGTPSADSLMASGHFKQFMTNRGPLSQDQIAAITDNKPRISLVLQDIGQRETVIQSVIEKFPPSVALGLSPYTPDFNVVSRNLRMKGFENWLMLKTLVAAQNTDTGDKILTPVAGYNANIPMLNAQIKDKAHLSGIVIESASLLTESELLWAELSHEIFAEGFGIFDATAPSFPSSFYYYEQTPAPYIKGAVTINANVPKDKLETALESAIATIQNDRNITIAVTPHTPASLDILAKWVNSLPAKGITLIPLSAQTTMQ